MNSCDYGHFRRRNPVVPLHQGYRQTESDSEHANDRHPAIFDPHHQRGFRVAHATRGARDLRTAAVLRTRRVTAVCLQALRSQNTAPAFSTRGKNTEKFQTPSLAASSSTLFTAKSTAIVGAVSPRPGPCSFGRATCAVLKPSAAAAARSLEWAATIMQASGLRSRASAAAR